MANENPSWGYTQIHGALLNLEINVGRGTIRRILKDHLIEPAPTRGRRIPWSMFLKAHWKAIAASHFDVGSWTGLMTHHVLFVIELTTRRAALYGPPPRSLDLTAFAGRLVQPIHSQRLSNLIPIGAPLRRRAFADSRHHDDVERNHPQVLVHKQIAPTPIQYSTTQPIDR